MKKYIANNMSICFNYINSIKCVKAMSIQKMSGEYNERKSK